MDLDSYYATTIFKGDKSNDFPTGSDPEAALERAKEWIETAAKAHFKSNPKALTHNWEEAGNVLATGPDGPANEPTASLKVRRDVSGKAEFDWIE